jgi:hypothetical protein
MKIIILITSFLSAAIVNAAPFPRAIPSTTIEPELGVFTHQKAGFKIEAKNTGWVLDQAPKGTQGVEALFHSPSEGGKDRGLLTIRIDQDIQAPTFQAYMEKWNQEYPRYGFDVLGTRAFELNGQSGYVVDLINKERSRQMRQVIYHKDKMAVVLSCRDDVKKFENTLKSCNTIMKSFTWLNNANEEAPQDQEATKTETTTN